MSTVLDLAVAISLTDRVSGGITNIIRNFGLMKNASQEVQRSMNSFKNMAWTGGIFAAGGIASFVGLTNAIKDTIDVAAEFQDVMNDVKIAAFGKDLVDKTKLQEINEVVADLTKGFEKLGVATKFSDTSTAQAALGMLKGGLDKQFLLGSELNGEYNYSGLAATMYAAQLGKTDPNTAGDFIAKQKAAFNLSPDRTLEAVNFYTKTSAASTMDFKDLMSGMLTASGVAGTLGMTPEDTALLVAATGTYTKDGGSAGTFTKDFLDRLIPHTKKQKEAMSDLGWMKSDGTSIFFDSDGKNKGADFLFSELQKASQKFRPDQFQNMMHKVFLEQGKNTALALATSSKVYSEIKGNVGNQLDMYQQIEIQMSGTKNLMESLGETWKIIKRLLGEPFLDPLSESIKKLNKLMGDFVIPWLKAHPEVVKVITILTIAGTTFLSIAGLIMVSVAAFGALTTALGAAGIGFGAIAAISGGVILAIGAIAAVGYLIYSNWDKIKPYASAVWEYVSTKTTNAWNSIMAAVGPAAREVWSIIQSAWSEIRRWTDENWDDISKTIGIVWQLIKNTIDTHITMISFIVGAAWDAITILTKTYWPVIKDVIKLNWDLVSGLLKVGMKLLQGDWSGAWEAVKDTASKVWNDIKSMFGSSFDSIQKSFINFQIIVGKGVLLIIGNIQKLFPTLLTLVEVFDKVAGTNFAEEINRKINSVIANTKRELASLNQQKINIEVSAQIKDAKTNYSGKEYMNIVKNYIDGSHYNGLYNVPYDNYLGLLHKDEMVLTKSQADSVRKGQNNSQVVKPPQRQSSIVIGNGGSLVSIGSVQQQPGENAEAFADRVARKAVAIMSRNSKMGRLTTGTTGGGIG